MLLQKRESGVTARVKRGYLSIGIIEKPLRGRGQ
jgi:hypothetical protein